MSDVKALSRRNMFTGNSGQAPESQEHICSLVVHVRPEHVAAVVTALGSMSGVETHGQAVAGKLVVTVESTSDDHIVQTMGRIGELPGVLSTALVFQHADSAGGQS
jgi:nitrate reductase NapD